MYIGASILALAASVGAIEWKPNKCDWQSCDEDKCGRVIIHRALAAVSNNRDYTYAPIGCHPVKFRIDYEVRQSNTGNIELWHHGQRIITKLIPYKTPPAPPNTMTVFDKTKCPKCPAHTKIITHDWWENNVHVSEEERR